MHNKDSSDTSMIFAIIGIGLAVMGLVLPTCQTIGCIVNYNPLKTFSFGSSLYASGIITVDNTKNWTVASLGITVPTGSESFFIPTSGGFNYIGSSITADTQFSVWLNITTTGSPTGSQKTAKYPVEALLSFTNKIHFDLGAALRFADSGFWTGTHAPDTYTIILTVRVDGSATPSPTIAISDRYLNIASVSRNT